MSRITSTTHISDTLALISEIYEELDANYDPEVCNPLCLYGAAAAQGLVTDLIENNSPQLFDLAETEMVVDLHNLCGDIIRQFELKDH